MIVTIEGSSYSSVISPHSLPYPSHLCHYQQREREELLHEVDTELAARPFAGSSSKWVRYHKGARESSPSRPTVAPAPVVLDLIPIIRKRHYEVNMRRMVAPIAGCTITAEAWRDTLNEETGEQVEHDISDTFHFLFQNVQTYLQETERNFAKLVKKKRVLYGVETTDQEERSCCSFAGRSSFTAE